MKITRRDIAVFLYIVAVLAIFLSWKLIYTPNIEETETVISECSTLQTQLQELQDKESLKPQYESEIAADVAEMDEIQSQYPTYLKSQDLIMYVNELKNNLDTQTTSLSFSSATPIYTIAGTGDASDYNMTTYAITMNIDYKTDYDGFKKIMDYINNDEEHKSIGSVSVSINSKTEEEMQDYHDESGNLVEGDPNTMSGSIQITLYYIDNENITTEQTSADSESGDTEATETETAGRYDVPDVDKGVPDIFRTVKDSNTTVSYDVESSEEYTEETAASEEAVSEETESITEETVVAE